MRENFFWHKMHSLTGVIPTGFYLVQHLTLNTFSLAGEDRFNGVIGFFSSMPPQIILSLKAVIWICLIFHAVYGVFIISRSKGNYSQTSLKYRENQYYTLQRWSGIFAFIFLAWHMASTSVYGSINGHAVIEYDTWQARLAAPNGTYLMMAFYVMGVLASTYHFAYGLWNFCIRWGITVSESSQQKMAKFSKVVFLAVSALGIAALVGFFNPVLKKDDHHASASSTRIEASTTRPASYSAAPQDER